MALHTGEADLRDGDYYGTAVNRCARLRAVGHGGQTLLSAATYRPGQRSPPDGVSLRDLGEHRLKDLADLNVYYQVVLPASAPTSSPLNTLDVAPQQPALPPHRPYRTRQETGGRPQRLRDRRGSLTLTGPGGTGKTRLGAPGRRRSA